ncbi:Protein of unknown function, partial [Cotesia congregata]
RAVAYRIRPLLPKHWTGFESGCILFCSAQEIQTSSNLKSVPPTVVAHDQKLKNLKEQIFLRVID